MEEHKHFYICTLYYLDNHLSEVMQAINEANKPCYVTRMGRFIAVLHPLTTAKIERQIALTLGQEEFDHTLSAEEVAEELGIDLD